MSDTARVFALMYLASADASIACWDAKYHYNFWRPLPAISNGDLDGNDGTAGDGTWRPLFPTPPHPEYIPAILDQQQCDGQHARVSARRRSRRDQRHSPTFLGFTRQWADVQ